MARPNPRSTASRAISFRPSGRVVRGADANGPRRQVRAQDAQRVERVGGERSRLGPRPRAASQVANRPGRDRIRDAEAPPLGPVGEQLQRPHDDAAHHLAGGRSVEGLAGRGEQAPAAHGHGHHLDRQVGRHQQGQLVRRHAGVPDRDDAAGDQAPRVRAGPLDPSGADRLELAALGRVDEDPERPLPGPPVRLAAQVALQLAAVPSGGLAAEADGRQGRRVRRPRVHRRVHHQDRTVQGDPVEVGPVQPVAPAHERLPVAPPHDPSPRGCRRGRPPESGDDLRRRPGAPEVRPAVERDGVAQVVVRVDEGRHDHGVAQVHGPAGSPPGDGVARARPVDPAVVQDEGVRRGRIGRVARPDRPGKDERPGHATVGVTSAPSHSNVGTISSIVVARSIDMKSTPASP